MAVPGSRKGEAIGYPCTDRELIRAANSLDADSNSSGVIIGAIFFWGDAIASLPSGCVICDGSANSSGSGLNLTNRFIKCVGTDAANKSLGAAGPVDGLGEHTHGDYSNPVVSSMENIVGSLSTDPSNIKATEKDGEHGHSGRTDYRSPRLDWDGEHTHEGLLSGESVTLALDGSHTHGTANSGVENVPPHPASDVAEMLGDHPSHTHGLTTFASEVQSGSARHTSTASVTGPMSPSDALEHDPPTLGAPELEHSPSHTHSVTFSSDGDHAHTLDQHQHLISGMSDGGHVHQTVPHHHDFTLEKTGDHYHVIEDKEHGHPVVFPEHDHLVTVGHGGGHDHTMGDPPCMQLIAVERIS
jgi:hypothetical protein